MSRKDLFGFLPLFGPRLSGPMQRGSDRFYFKTNVSMKKWDEIAAQDLETLSHFFQNFTQTHVPIWGYLILSNLSLRGPFSICTLKLLIVWIPCARSSCRASPCFSDTRKEGSLDLCHKGGKPGRRGLKIAQALNSTFVFLPLLGISPLRKSLF